MSVITGIAQRGALIAGAGAVGFMATPTQPDSHLRERALSGLAWAAGASVAIAAHGAYKGTGTGIRLSEAGIRYRAGTGTREQLIAAHQAHRVVWAQVPVPAATFALSGTALIAAR